MMEYVHKIFEYIGPAGLISVLVIIGLAWRRLSWTRTCGFLFMLVIVIVSLSFQAMEVIETQTDAIIQSLQSTPLHNRGRGAGFQESRMAGQDESYEHNIDVMESSEPVRASNNMSASTESGNVRQQDPKIAVTEEQEQHCCEHVQFLSTLAPVPCIEHLAEMAKTHFYRGGRAVEVETSNGSRSMLDKHLSPQFTSDNRRTWKGTYIFHAANNSADLGQAFPDSFKSQGSDDIPDELFDWVLLTGLAKYSGDLSGLLKSWWANVRPGGVMTGDGYIGKVSKIGTAKSTEAVISVLQRFAVDEGVILHVTWMKLALQTQYRQKCFHKFPGWYIVKPVVKGPDLSGVSHFSVQSSCCSYLRRSSKIAPVNCRNNFANVAEVADGNLGRAAEVGVFQGAFAAQNLATWTKDYYAIDAWRFRPADPGDKNINDKQWNDYNYDYTRSKLRNFNKSGRVQQIRALSTEAYLMFPDAYFDWIYIDALHTKEALTQDLKVWWPKLRSGGLMSGDDYGDMSDTQYVTAKFWSTVYGDVAMQGANLWGVISAMQEFARNHQVILHVTWAASRVPGNKPKDCYEYPAWYIFKP